jgi:hypothetical protein
MTNKQVINPSNQIFVNMLIFVVSPMKVGATPKVLARRSSRITRGPSWLHDYACIVVMDEPLTRHEALKRGNVNKWKEATNK